MQPAMKSHVFPFLCLVALLGLASGLTMEVVRLVNNRDYISYKLGPSANNSLLECVYHLDEAEEVYQVIWLMWKNVQIVGSYLWRPGAVGQAGGSLTGVVDLNRDDESLELTKLRYDLGGWYTCCVILTNNVSDSTEKEVFIVDNIAPDLLDEHYQRCAFSTSYRTMAVFPEQTVHAGMFSPKLNKFYEEVPSLDWQNIVYANGSAAYSYNDVTFQINGKTPDDIVFKFMRGIYKYNRDFIKLSGSTVSDPTWNEAGCLDVREDNNKTVKYYPEYSIVCRGGRTNITTALVFCRNGYHPEGNVTLVKVRCDGPSLTWKPEPGYTATLEDLVCVEDTVPTTEEPDNIAASSGHPSLVLLLASLLGVGVRLFSHP